MFRKQTPIILREQHTEYVTREVHEHRAPTDESVKLLKEMEEVALKKIVDAVHVGNTSFECVVHHDNDFATNRIILGSIFKLNGAKQTAKIYLDRSELADQEAVVTKLRDEMAKVIATQILRPALASMRLPRAQ